LLLESDLASAELNTPKMVRWNGGRRLALLLPAIIVMVALTSSIYEFWLEDPIYSHYGWPLDETLNEKLRYVVQAVGFTSVAVIGPGILLFRSLAQLRRAHEQLQRAFHVAQSANTAKSQFLANMSHELRTPLNAVIGFADIMQAEMFGPLLPRYREYVSDVKNAGLHLLDVINDVLDISKAEAAEISIRQSDIELAGYSRNWKCSRAAWPRRLA
jgi:signal transduction histidine kinase